MVSNDALPPDEGINKVNETLRPPQRRLSTPSREEIRRAFGVKEDEELPEGHAREQ